MKNSCRAGVGAAVTMTALLGVSAFAGTRSWTGEAGDGKWNTPGNWADSTVPASGDAVSIGTSAGGTLEQDIEDLTLLSLGYAAEAGAYTVRGRKLGVATMLTNASETKAQTISASVELGTDGADETVTVGGAGAISLSGTTSYRGEKLVKQGAGVFTTTDGAVYGARHIVVEGGTFKIGARTNPYTDESKYYPGTLSTNVNDQTLLWRDTQLADVVGVSGRPGTGTMGYTAVMNPFVWTNDGQDASVQFQMWSDNGRYIMTVFVSFKQVGSDVYACATKALYSEDLTSLGYDWTNSNSGNYRVAFSNQKVVGPGVTSGGYNVRDVMPIFKDGGASPWVAGYVPYEEEKLVWKNTRLADVTSATADAIGRAGYYRPGPWLWTNDGQTATVQFQHYDGTYTKSVTVRLVQKGADVWAKALYACYTKAKCLGTDMSVGYTKMNSSETSGYAVQNIRPVYNKAPGAEATFTVKDGGRLDVALNHGSAQSLQKTESTHGKVIYVAGDGPDGNGALFNSDASLRYGCTFGHIVLTGDASVGGSGRMDVRPLVHSAVAAEDNSAILEGPYAFTARGDLFVIYQTTINVDRIDVANLLSIQGPVFGTVTNGIHLLSGSKLLFDSSTKTPVGMPLFVDEGEATVTNYSGNAASVAGALTVGAGARLNITGRGVVAVGDAAKVDGVVVVGAADGLSLGTSLEGSGTLIGKTAFTGDDFTWKLTANAEGLASAVDLDGAVEANPDLLLGVRKVEVVFETQPDVAQTWEHRLAAAGNLTEDDVAAIAVSAVDAEGEVVPGAKLKLADGGLVLCANDETIPAVVHWTGAGDVTDPSDPDNWACTNFFGQAIPGAIPTLHSTVRLSGGLAFSCPAGATFVCKELVLVDAPALSADCDWSGLDLGCIVEGGTVDLNGHNLTLSLPADVAKAFTVTDTQARGLGGELHLVVPKGVTAKNEKLSLTGSLKLVKDGEGTLTAAKTQQTYSGGTEIVTGLVNLPAEESRDLTYAGNKWLFGAQGSPLTIRKDGAFDICGNYVYNVYATVLDGGVLSNSVQQTDWNLNGFGGITLTSDSRIVALQDTVFYVSGADRTRPINLNGKTLTVKIGTGRNFIMNSFGAFTNGTVNFDTDGWFRPYPCNNHRNVLDLRTVRFISKAALWPEIDVRFGDLVMERASGQSNGTGTNYIYGVYTPVSDYLKCFKMMDGSTLNLSQATLPWNICSTLTKDTLAFEDKAKLCVDLTGQPAELGDKVLAWAAKPANANTLKFRVTDSGGRLQGSYLKVAEDGAYLSCGTTIIIK